MKILKFCLFIAPLLLLSCGKDDDELNLGGAGITMTVDGQEWKSLAAHVNSVTYDGDDTHVVNIVGTKASMDDENFEEAEGFSLVLAIPASKFNNPAGTYEIGAGMGDEDSQHAAIAYFNRHENGKFTHYTSFDPEDGSKTMGTITIEKFKIGEQKFLGESLGMGYTELSGTFSVTLNSYLEGEADVRSIEIKNGRFNLKSGLGLGGMFSSSN